MEVTYANLCPVCGGDLNSDEILSSTCKIRNKPLCSFEEDYYLEKFISLYRCCIGEPRAIQKMWARRILRGESFAATAPTGIGKTSFGILMGIFQALNGKRSYLIFPTTLLVLQCMESIKNCARKARIEIKVNEPGKLSVGYYHGKLKKESKDAFFRNLKDFKILVTTTQFLSKHFDEIRDERFDFIFVDDVDSILKASRNVERILQLLGFHKDEEWKKAKNGVLMVSTATAKVGRKTRLFRTLLNFDVGSAIYTIRNIEDFAVNSEDIELIYDILSRMGKGGIIYARNTSEARKIFEELRDKYRVGLVVAGKDKDFDLFAKGELDFLLGTAYYYGSLIRGLDLPERIRYTVFIGCPTFRIRIDDIENAPTGILRSMALVFKDEPEISKLLPYLKNLERKTKLQIELRNLLKKLLKERKVEVRDVLIRKGEIIFPDVRTYIQGSGRTSRLFASGITKGASFLLESDRDILNSFIERAKYYDIDFKDLKQADFEKLTKELDVTRERFKMKHRYEPIRPALFVVESPTKAKQISKFFGKPSIKSLNGLIVYEIPTEEYILLITASVGHITDLITDRGYYGVEVDEVFIPIYSSIKRCKNCNNQFTGESGSCPKCGCKEIDDSKTRIEQLRKLARETGLVIIGTDPDTEGEKIAWDIKNLLSGCGKVKRAEFHEVTKRAVLEALKSLRDINVNLVRAQIVRRIEDRWIGFKLSQKLWEAFKKRNLSAGRAQTPVLGWIIDRHKKARERKKIAIIENLDLVLEFDKPEFEIEIELLSESEEEKIPLPPYTTNTLLQDANQILNFSSKVTMQIAQDLFENGLITYHRTDSTRVSEVGLKVAKEYLKNDFYGRTWSEEGAHECIRPTRNIDKDTLYRLNQEGIISLENPTWRHFALYDLIFRRFMASQAKPFKVKIKKYRIKFDNREIIEERTVSAEGKAFELFKSIWIRKSLPEGKFSVKAKIRRIPKITLFTQSEVIKKMQEKGIGRPSTYATIIDRLFLRRYVIEKNGRLVPTKLGFEVYEYLINRYGSFVSEYRTKVLEEKMDAIERGELDYYDSIKELYDEIRNIN